MAYGGAEILRVSTSSGTLLSSEASLQRKKVNVLVVDDSLDSLVALEALLTGRDRNIIKASSGEEALKHLLQEDIGVLLLDVKMAGLDGYQTAAIIRQREQTRDVPIIFLTAYYKDDSDVAKGYAMGAADYVFKPVVPDILKSKVNCFVELAKRTEALKAANAELRHARRELDYTRSELERRVEERTSELARANKLLEDKIAELEKFEEVVVGRELKMIALEKELEQLRLPLKRA
jgi:response regulator RpfG family c-di-GMP phosphodiesterase